MSSGALRERFWRGVELPGPLSEHCLRSPKLVNYVEASLLIVIYVFGVTSAVLQGLRKAKGRRVSYSTI